MTTIAAHVIAKVGGVDAVASALGLNVSTVHRWTYPKERGGTGGTVPTKHQRELLAVARERGIDLSPADFFDPPAAAATAA